MGKEGREIRTPYVLMGILNGTAGNKKKKEGCSYFRKQSDELPPEIKCSYLMTQQFPSVDLRRSENVYSLTLVRIAIVSFIHKSQEAETTKMSIN